MQEAAMQPNGVPRRLPELVCKDFVLVDALDQRVPVDVALGVSAHRRVQVEERHLVRRIGDRLSVDHKRFYMNRPLPGSSQRSSSGAAAGDGSGLGVAHAP